MFYHHLNHCLPLATSTTGTTSPCAAEFKSFQRLFLSVYLLMMMADWIQGPYVYALYDHYGFSKGQIGQLFIVGFGSSMLFGTVVGGLADKYGRKLNCVLFVILYGLSCATKHFNNFEILLVGRLLGGVATSILFSAFETWMIHEHRSAGFSEELLSSTFSGMTFGSSLVAIVAGLVASMLAANVGFVAPFDASLALLIVGGVVISYQWKENYGEAASTGRISTGFDNFGKAWTLLRTNERVMLLGLIQSCFESAMYIFVFMWTPALETSLAAWFNAQKALVSPADLAGMPPSLPHGVIFATFMVAIMIGSKAFEVILAQPGASVEGMARWMFVVAGASLAVPILTSHHTVQLVAMCIFEVCCGIYFPSAVSAGSGMSTGVSHAPGASPQPPRHLSHNCRASPSTPLPPSTPICRAPCAPSSSPRRCAPR